MFEVITDGCGIPGRDSSLQLPGYVEAEKNKEKMKAEQCCLNYYCLT